MSEPLIEQVKAVLTETLRLNAHAMLWRDETVLMGSVPELDSLAVINVITALEDRFGIHIHDDEVSGELFATVGALTSFIRTKLSEKKPAG